jgi:hypothetical protein
MNWLASVAWRFGLGIALMTPGLRGAHAAIPLLPLCTWPVESTGQGILNVATQDTNTTYWFMPIDTSLWSSVVIQGTYPEARFFNFTSYDGTGSLIGTIADSQIAPDPGSTNPFATPTANEPHNYTVTLGNGGSGSDNVLNVGGSRLVFIVFRVIVPDQGLDKTGGVGLPAVSFVARDGSVRQPQPCPFAASDSSLGNMITILIASGFSDAAAFLENILSTAKLSIADGCTGTQSGGAAAVTFGPAPGTSFFPNPATIYLQTPNLCFQSPEVLVIRGRALVFPNTFLGGSIFDPAFDGQIQTRYWSMCNNDGVIPYPVIGCDADFQTKLDQSESYTYVVSPDTAPPSWLPADATWLPWGPTNVPITVIFRSVLTNYSTIPAAFYPTGVICNQTLLIAQGWQACFAAAGLSVPSGS